MRTSSLSILLNILGHNKWFYLVSSGLFIGVVFLRTLEPKVFQWLTDELVTLTKSPDSFMEVINRLPLMHYLSDNLTPFFSVLVYFSLLYVILTFSRSVIVFLAHALNAFSTEDALGRLRNKLFSHLQSISIHHYINHSKGEIIQRSTNDLEVVKNFVQNHIVEVIRIFFVLVFSIIIMVKINLAVTLVSLCLMPFVVILSVKFYKREKLIWEKHEEESDLLNNIIQENIQGIRTIKAHANEPDAIKTFEKQNQRRLDAGLKHNELHCFYWPFMNLLVFLQIVVSNIFGIYMTSRGYLTIGELLGVGIIVNMMLWPVRQVSSVLSNFSMAMVALQRINELLSIPKEEDIEADINQTLEGTIEFVNVSFQYPGQKNYALRNVSFKINAGEKVAIIGPTGAGKSTIGKLLLRLYEPSEGTILLDNLDIKIYSKAYLRKHIGIALQNSILFSATIRENLRTVNPKANFDQMKEAMENASIGGLLEDNGAGLDKIIGEKGINVSGGQKQRLALSRLLLKKSDIFILDDVTSYIDELNEQSIMRSLNIAMEGCTCILISHKLSSIFFAEKIIVISNGMVQQSGRRDVLEKLDGYYNVIYNLQTEGKAVINEFTHSQS